MPPGTLVRTGVRRSQQARDFTPPKNVYQPGEAGHRGKFSDQSGAQRSWEARIAGVNMREGWARDDTKMNRKYGKVVLGLTAGSAGVGVGTGLAGRRNIKRKNQQLRTRLAKADAHQAYNVADVLMRHGVKNRRGVHDISSLPPRKSRFNRAAEATGRFLNTDYGPSVVGTGLTGALYGGAVAPMYRPAQEHKRLQRKVAAKQRQERKARLVKRDTRKDRSASGATIAGGGAATAATGLAGGGIPGFRSDSDTIRNVRRGPWRQRTGAALSSGRGGVFGYRIDAHQGALDRFRADEKHHAGTPTSRANMFLRGRGSGKIKPEVDIIGHLKRARRVSNVALLGGGAVTAYGVKRARGPKVAKAERDLERYHGVLLGTGGTTAVIAGAGDRVLRHQGRKWAQREARSLKEAARIVPNMKPGVPDRDVARNKKILAGKSKVQAEAAGRARGAATQQRYFSHVYNHSAKIARRVRNPALATAAVGGGGLLLARKKSGPVIKASRRDYAETGAATVLGGAGGQGAYQLAGYGTRHQALRSAGWNALKTTPAHQRPGGSAQRYTPEQWKQLKIQDKQRKDWRKKKLGSSTAHPGSADWRTFPKEHPRAKTFRVLGHTHGGRTGVATGAASTALGALGVGGYAAHRKVHKAMLYERDKHTSLLHAAGATAGLGLAAWGLPRHKFLGPALAHGVKQATKHESQAALEALQLAEQAANSLRNVTGRGERRLRTIQHLDQAINRVPRAIRPEVATAAGVLLVGHSRPVRRERYTPVIVGGGY